MKAFLELLAEKPIEFDGLDSEGIVKWSKDLGIADESLISFLKDTKYSEKTLANYQLWLKSTANTTTFFSRATKVATTVLKSLMATLGSMVVAWLASTVISVVVQVVEKIVHKVENAKEAMEGLEDEIKSIKSNLDSMNATIKTSAKRFAELSQGVNQFTGENSSLSTDDYNEFLDLSNQIAALFPSLSRIYNENGDAIVQLSGDIDTIVESLNNLVAVQRQLANQELADKLPDTFKNAKTVYTDAESKIKSLEARAKQVQEQAQKYLPYLNGLIAVYGTEAQEGYEHDNAILIRDMCREISYWEPVDREIDLGSIDYFQFLISEFEKKLDSIYKDISLQEQVKTSQYATLNQVIAAWLYEDYAILGDDILAGVQMALNGVDWSELELSNDEELQEHIKKNLITPLQDNPELRDLFLQLFSLDAGDLDRVEIAEKIQSILDSLHLKFDITPVIATEQTAKERLGNSIRTLMSDYHIFDSGAEAAMVESTIGEIERVAGGLTPEIVDTWLEATSNSQNLKEAFHAFSDALTGDLLEDSSSFSLTEDQSKAISDYQSDLEKLQKTLSNIDNSNFAHKF